MLTADDLDYPPGHGVFQFTPQSRRACKGAVEACHFIRPCHWRDHPHPTLPHQGGGLEEECGNELSIYQAAHSGRELIDQTLKFLAPDQQVKAQPDFKGDKTSNSGVTRRHRIRYAMAHAKGHVSGSDSTVAEKACDLVVAIDDKLKGLSHARNVPEKQDVQDALLAAEIALRRVIL